MATQRAAGAPSAKLRGRSRRKLSEDLRSERTDGHHPGAADDGLLVLFPIDRLQELVKLPKLLHDRAWVGALATVDRETKAAVVEESAMAVDEAGHFRAISASPKPPSALLLDARELAQALTDAVVEHTRRLIR